MFIMCTSNRILIVDDDPRTLARYRRALESAGYAVDEAEGEEAALEKLRRSKSDLVLLALSPPWIIDMRVLRSLRCAGDDVPVVIIMARGNTFDAKAALELGAIDFLFEPVRPEELRTVVAEVIRRHDLARSKPVDPAQTAALLAAVFDESLMRAKQALNRREFPQAEMALRQATALRPDSVTALSLLGILHELRGDRVGAGRCYQEAYRADPSQELARSNMLRLYHSE